VMFLPYSEISYGFALSVCRPAECITDTNCHNMTIEDRRLIPIKRSTICAGELSYIYKGNYNVVSHCNENILLIE
jgi:hypothetical protein